MHAWQFTVDWLTWQMLPSCILHPRIEFRKWHKLRTASHSLSITNEFIIKSLSHRYCAFTPRTMTVEENPTPISFSLPLFLCLLLSISFPSLEKIGRAGTSWAAEERWRMGFSPLRRPRRRVQNRKDVCVNYRFFAHAFGDGCDCLVIPRWAFSRVDGEFFKNNQAKTSGGTSTITWISAWPVRRQSEVFDSDVWQGPLTPSLLLLFTSRPSSFHYPLRKYKLL